MPTILGRPMPIRPKEPRLFVRPTQPSPVAKDKITPEKNYDSPE